MANRVTGTTNIGATINNGVNFTTLSLLRRSTSLCILRLSDFRLRAASSLGLGTTTFLGLSRSRVSECRKVTSCQRTGLHVFSRTRIYVIGHSSGTACPSRSNGTIGDFNFSRNSCNYVRLGRARCLTGNSVRVLTANRLNLINGRGVTGDLITVTLLSTIKVSLSLALRALETCGKLAREYRIITSGRNVH